MCVNPAWVDPAIFGGCQIMEVPEGEGSGANVLDLGDCVVVSESFPKMRAQIEQCGIECYSLASDELAKAEGALTCCSLLVR